MHTLHRIAVAHVVQRRHQNIGQNHVGADPQKSTVETVLGPKDVLNSFFS